MQEPFSFLYQSNRWQCCIQTFFRHTFFLKLRIGQFSDTQKSPRSCSWVFKNIWYSMHLGKDKCNKKVTKKCYKNFFGCFFEGANNFQMVPKQIWIGHWLGWYKTFFKFLVLLIDFTLQKYTFLKSCVRIWVINVPISKCTTHKPCYIY